MNYRRYPTSKERRAKKERILEGRMAGILTERPAKPPMVFRPWPKRAKKGT